MEGARKIAGHCGDKAFLYYFGRQGTAQGAVRLPQDKTYRVEVIDVWEMTRTIYGRSVSGHLTVPLPGKAGMAVLAVAEENNMKKSLEPLFTPGKLEIVK